ncbi:MAG TPA: hypothetical protein VGK67_16855 [Myxococcales bacterium]
MPKRLALLSLAVLASAACTHLKATGTSDSLKQTADTFFRFQRWGPDLRGAAQAVVPEAQQGWLNKALDANEDENLKLTEAELDDLKLLPDGSATTVTKVTWHRLPSVSTKTERVTIEWVDRSGVWYAAAITGGPLPLVALPKAAPEADGGTAP